MQKGKYENLHSAIVDNNQSLDYFQMQVRCTKEVPLFLALNISLPHFHYPLLPKMTSNLEIYTIRYSYNENISYLLHYLLIYFSVCWFQFQAVYFKIKIMQYSKKKENLQHNSNFNLKHSLISDNASLIKYEILFLFKTKM